MQSEKITNSKVQTPQTNCHFWGGRNKNSILGMMPAQSTTKGVGRPHKSPEQPKPWTCRPPSARLRNQPILLGCQQGHLLLVFIPLCCSILFWGKTSREGPSSYLYGGPSNIHLRGILITVPETDLINLHSFPSFQCLLPFVWQPTKVYHSPPEHMGQTFLSSWYPDSNKSSMANEKAAFLCACCNTLLSPGDSNVSCLPGINHLGRLVENMKKG